jgi:hypothetical protein
MPGRQCLSASSGRAPAFCISNDHENRGRSPQLTGYFKMCHAIDLFPEGGC